MNVLQGNMNTITLQIQNLIHPTDEPAVIPPIHDSCFQLPIQYLDKKYIHSLSPIVIQDLELTETDAINKGQPMYDILLQPKHEFAKEMIQKWSSSFTNHIPYLLESQQVITNTESYIAEMDKHPYTMDSDNIITIWKSVKEDPYFLEHYAYMEWELLKHLNDSSSFLQCTATIHLMSPIATFFFPILFLILPFFILKMQSVPIDFVTYIDVLKEISKNHIIGSTINSMQNISVNNVCYAFISIAFYFLQLYQNTVAILRFYKNISKIKKHLYDIKQYILYSIRSIDTFNQLNEDLTYYKTFCQDAHVHEENLQRLYGHLCDITTDSFTLSQFQEIGYLLNCYYTIHSNPDYDASLRFSFSFEGYMNNILGLYENKKSAHIAFGSYDTETDTKITKQYYPPYVGKKHVKNDCHFDKNMIITGVNASGKTTILKTTSINIIFTQQFGCGFYDNFVLNPYTHIHSYLNIPDTSGRDSLFQAESRRCKEIIDTIGFNKTDTEKRHFCIFDELYSGTNPVEATKAAYAFLLYLSQFKNVNFVLTTHYNSICKKIKEEHNIRNYKMSVHETEDNKLIYTYKLKKGTCRIQGAIEILKSMNYPIEIINTINTVKI